MGGTATGPLYGVPIALKDLYATAGIRTTAHSRVLVDWVPTEDATTTAMLKAAREAAEAAGQDRPLLLGVTVLTSLDAEALHDIGVAGGPRQQVIRLARLALASGADGLVCSAHEVAPLRDALGPDVLLVVPGIRPAGSATQDQNRVMGPKEAMEAGASWLVIGRPITGAPDPAAAARDILTELQ